MRYAQLIALWVIALALSADVAMRYVVPAATLFLHREAYAAASALCHEARANAEEVEALASGEDAETAFAFRQTGLTGLLECYEQQRLRQTLLAAGVSVHALEGIEFKARLSSSANLPYVVEDAAGP